MAKIPGHAIYWRECTPCPNYHNSGIEVENTGLVKSAR
jgi:hypothetical protein